MLKNWIGATVLTAAAALVAYPADETPPAAEPEAPRQMLADVHILKPESRHSTITTHGQVRPRWQSRLSVEVGGRVVSVSDSLVTGGRFQAGRNPRPDRRQRLPQCGCFSTLGPGQRRARTAGGGAAQ